MKYQISDKSRNLIFFCFIAIIIVSLIVVNNIGSKQDKVFAEDIQRYNYALQLLSENKPSEAQPLLKELFEKYPDNYEVIWGYGIVQSQLRNFEQAHLFYQQAQEKNITLVRDPLFLVQYGELLLNLGEEEKAKVYLEESLKQNPSEQIINAANSLLGIISRIDQQ